MIEISQHAYDRALERYSLNRKTQSLFECVKCGHTDNADFQATLNLLQWGQTLMEAKTDH